MVIGFNICTVIVNICITSFHKIFKCTKINENIPNVYIQHFEISFEKTENSKNYYYQVPLVGLFDSGERVGVVLGSPLG